MRKKLDTAKAWAMAINMQSNLASMANGDANEDVMWDTVEGFLMWKKVAESRKFPQAHAVMSDISNNVLAHVLHRWEQTGVVHMKEDERRKAVEAANWAEALAEEVDAITAHHAAVWSEHIGHTMRQRYQQDRIKVIDQTISKIDAIVALRKADTALGAQPREIKPDQEERPRSQC